MCYLRIQHPSLQSHGLRGAHKNVLRREISVHQTGPRALQLSRQLLQSRRNHRYLPRCCPVEGIGAQGPQAIPATQNLRKLIDISSADMPRCECVAKVRCYGGKSCAIELRRSGFGIEHLLAPILPRLRRSLDDKNGSLRMAPHHSWNSARCQAAEALQGNRLGESPRDISLPKGWRAQGRKGSLDNQAMWIPLPDIRF